MNKTKKETKVENTIIQENQLPIGFLLFADGFEADAPQ